MKDYFFGAVNKQWKLLKISYTLTLTIQYLYHIQDE